MSSKLVASVYMIQGRNIFMHKSPGQYKNMVKYMNLVSNKSVYVSQCVSTTELSI